MARKLAGRIAVVTGGTTGIGFASAKRFAAEGARVFITGRRQVELDKAVAAIGGNTTGIQADSAKMVDLDRLYAQVKAEAGRIDILFANAGGGSNLPLGSITEEQYDDTFDRNVRGVLFTVQKALPLLVDGASVILTGSTASIVAMPAFSVYGASKAALRSFARHWTLDLKSRRIRVNVLSPVQHRRRVYSTSLATTGRRSRACLIRWRRNCRSAELLNRTRSPAQRCSLRPMIPVSSPAPSCSSMVDKRRSERE
jgi:NAD(P)-dependent dehydrogenase (short-subunit alcohol dehydrogenase family)